MALKTQLSIQDTIYSDFLDNLDVHPILGDLVTNTNEAAVKRAIKNLIMIDYYDIPFKPLVGCGIRNLLFENFTPATLQALKNQITSTITNYEPRAQLISVYINTQPDNNSLSVSITFGLVNTEQPITVNIPLMRDR